MSRPAGFIILLYLLTFDVNYCIRCDLKTSRKMFKDESGTEWECSIYCPEIRGCKDQCCPTDAAVKNNENVKDRKVDKPYVPEGDNSGQSKELSGKVIHMTISPATGAVIGVMICIFAVVVVALSLKLSRISTAAREGQQRADAELQDTHSLRSCHIAQASSDTDLLPLFSELRETVV